MNVLKINNKLKNKLMSGIALLGISSMVICPLTACEKAADDVIVLRVCNWEEYMDEGDWDEEEAMEINDEVTIYGENSMVEDYEEWFYETYGKKVVVEYSTFGTNEELYNQLTLGDEYDLVCPSEYMIMKMMTEDMVVPFSEEFFDMENENNYYVRNVSPYINERLQNLSIDGKTLDKYASCYMWGTLGIVYNPEYITKEQAAHWDILLDPSVYKQVTIKDSVRDAYFAGNAIYNYDLLMSEEFRNSDDYFARLDEVLNATDSTTVDGVEAILSSAQKNVYSFETDAGKADMVTGKVYANQQWSGDAVYTLDQAEEDGLELCYSAPEEATNLWFDGWCMLDKGIGGDADKQMAAEAFVNFMARPDNAIRNMYYIGYTSSIAGVSDGLISDYIEYNYGAEEDDDTAVPYDIGYFFGEDEYIVMTPEEQVDRQFGAQYPTKDIVDRSVVMAYFDKEGNERINRMWTNVRCFDLDSLFN